MRDYAESGASPTGCKGLKLISNEELIDMKKITLAALIACFMLAACNKGDAPTTEATTTEEAAATTAQPTEPAAQPAQPATEPQAQADVQNQQAQAAPTAEQPAAPAPVQ